jgi:hypothetical protein
MNDEAIFIAIALVTIFGAYIFYGISIEQLTAVQVALTAPPL